MKRRDFLTATVAAGALAAASAWMPTFAKSSRTLRVAILGTGLRGQVHLKELLRRPDVEVAAICDIDPIMLASALKMVEKAGKPRPRVYGENGDVNAWREMYAKGGLDAVFIVTPWEYHSIQAIEAMQARIAVGCEVVAGVTLDDHWKVLRAQQQSGTPYMLLENVCYRRDVLAVLNMVRNGVFGTLAHLQAGYQHDLRGVKFNSGNPDEPYNSGVEYGAKGWSEAQWRAQHSIDRNGDLYPSHGIGPCAMYTNINRGNRFTRIGSFSSGAHGLHDYIVKHPKGGPDHPNARLRFKLGDVVTTQIATENGETILLQHDTSLPRPYSMGFRVQGSNGLWMDVNDSIYVEGVSKPHTWDEAQAWLDKYDHPLWKRFGEEATGSGHGGMDFFVIHAFIEALKANEPMPIDIYDAVTWSAITPLSEQSIADRFQTIDFPDFTEGKWKTRQPIFALNDRY